MVSCPPVLLTRPDYYGTLAATRLFGDHGIPVTTADAHRLAPAAWSRHVTRRVRCPPAESTPELVAWLLAFGERHPGHVLYPTSDGLAWLFSAHAEELGRHFHLYSPPPAVMERVLDKASLYALCARVGIEVPRSWYPADTEELAAIAREASFPLLIKQRTQALSLTCSKGLTVADARHLPEAFAAFARANGHGDAIVRRQPEACRPMLQEYCPEVDDGTLLVGGFVDRSGRLLAARASAKILQKPRRLGIALCLEEACLEPSVAAGLEALCREAGYYGVFQVELIRVGGRFLLIDFNPRLYHYMVFEIARGMPLPLFAYRAAIGDEAGLAELGAAARESASPGGRTFADRLALEVMLRGQRITGRMSAGEARRWRRWYEEHRASMVDLTLDPDDPRPAYFDVAQRLGHWMRHPWAVVGRMLFNSE
jgi:D-aspartate ligase